MKYADIDKIHAAGLITAEQRRQIIERFGLKEEGARFLAIISWIGAVLATCGIVLLIAANWQEIPRGIKIAAGLGLMVGAHAGGYYLREVRREYGKTGEALHLVGAGLFLANIGLLGQIYHLSSRLPNAFLLWWLGIAAFPWLLRSRAQHILSLLAFGLWAGLELNERGSWLFLGQDQYQIVYYALLGLVYLGLGYCLRQTAFPEFAADTEQLGLLAFHGFFYPLTWKFFYGSHEWSDRSVALFCVLSALALVSIAWGLHVQGRLTRQWRWTWGLTLLGGIALMAGALLLPVTGGYGFWNQGEGTYYHWFAALGWFVLCLVQIQVGIQSGSPFAVNLGVAAIAFNILALYIGLIGSMARTGLMFLVSGMFLIGFGVYLEKKRRALLQQMKPIQA